MHSGGGGGGGKRVLMSQMCDVLVFQTWWLDLATHRCLLLINYNCIKIITITYRNY
jgi:hypothetical protein